MVASPRHNMEASMVIWIAAALLLVVAIAHSVLGEKFLISPLIASPAW